MKRADMTKNTTPPPISKYAEKQSTSSKTNVHCDHYYQRATFGPDVCIKCGCADWQSYNGGAKNFRAHDPRDPNNEGRN